MIISVACVIALLLGGFNNTILYGIQYLTSKPGYSYVVGEAVEWWDCEWSYSKKITIDHTKIASDQFHYPVLLSQSSDADLALHAQSNGGDIVFVDSFNSTQYYHELEVFDTSTGKMAAWVNIPSLSSSSDTILYMYYGNAYCEPQWNSTATWNSGFTMVHHLDETSAPVYDSTSSGITGSTSGGMSLDAAGKIGSGAYFEGLEGHINFGSHTSLNITGSLTLEAWVKDPPLQHLSSSPKTVDLKRSGVEIVDKHTEQKKVSDTEVFSVQRTIQSTSDDDLVFAILCSPGVTVVDILVDTISVYDMSYTADAATITSEKDIEDIRKSLDDSVSDLTTIYYTHPFIGSSQGLVITIVAVVQQSQALSHSGRMSYLVMDSKGGYDVEYTTYWTVLHSDPWWSPMPFFRSIYRFFFGDKTEEEIDVPADRDKFFDDSGESVYTKINAVTSLVSQAADIEMDQKGLRFFNDEYFDVTVSFQDLLVPKTLDADVDVIMHSFSSDASSGLFTVASDYLFSSSMKQDSRLPAALSAKNVRTDVVLHFEKENFGVGEILSGSVVLDDDSHLDISVRVHYHHVIVNYSFHSGGGTMFFEDVYSGEQPSLLPVDFQINKYDDPMHPGIVDRALMRYDNLYGDSHSVNVTIAYPWSKNESFLGMNKGEEIIPHLYSVVNASAHDLGRTETLLDTTTGYTIRSYNVSVLNNTVESIYFKIQSSFGEYNNLSMWITGSFAGGTGSSGDPYQISNWTHMNNVRDNMTASYILNNDLNSSTDGYDTYASSSANGGLGWLPIGNDFPISFRGTFDGDNYTISDLYIDRSGTNFIGLFGCIYRTSISNVGLLNVDITGQNKVGGLVGYDYQSTFYNCFVTGNVTGTGDEIGGFIGYFGGSVVDASYASVHVTGNNYLGGFTGYLLGSINNSYATGKVTSTSATTVNQLAGFVGSNYRSRITNSYSTGSVHYATLSDPTNKGFLGWISNSGGNYYMAGNFWDKDTSGQTSSAGSTLGGSELPVGKTTAEMQDFDTFDTAGWDIAKIEDFDDETWYIHDGVDYPRLGWEDFPSYIVTFNAQAGTTPSPETKQVTFLKLYGTLATTSKTGYTFTEWNTQADGGGDTITAASTVNIAEDHTLYAQWEIIQHDLHIDSTVGGSVTDPGEATFTYNYGTIVDIEAVPDETYHFVEWTGDNITIDNTKNNKTTITMHDDYTITAVFDISIFPPIVTTNASTGVQNMNATLWGYLSSNGTVDTTAGFRYGTNSGSYTNNVTYGVVANASAFSVNITALNPGQIYYYQAWANNSAGFANGTEMVFLSRPNATIQGSFHAQTNSSTIIYVTWEKGTGANNTIIEYNTTHSSWPRGEGFEIYNGSGINFEHTNLLEGTTYYYQAWGYASWNPQQYSQENSSTGNTTNTLPMITDPVPANESTGISLTPLMNITVADPDGDSMNLIWYSNSSGDWLEFGRNESVGNGTYHQINSNFSEYSTTYYWNVSVSDGKDINTSKVFHFTTTIDTPEVYLIPELDFSYFGLYTIQINTTNITKPIETMNITLTAINGDGDIYWDYYVNGTPASTPLSFQAEHIDEQLWQVYPISPDDIYPEIFFAPSDITWYNTPQDITIHRPQYHIFNYTNPFSMVGDMSLWLEVNAVPNHPRSPALSVYIVGNEEDLSYFTDDWRNKANTELMGTISSTTPFHHTHNQNSSHHLIRIGTHDNGTIGTKYLNISDQFWVIIYQEATSTQRGWSLRYHNQTVADNQAAWYKAERSGNTWNMPVHQPGAPDTHIHIARSNINRDGVNITVSLDKTYNSSHQFYFMPLSNLPPNPSAFITPDNTTQSGVINITWYPATDPNNDALTYTIQLTDTNGIYLQTLQTNTSQLYTEWDSTSVANGEYDLTIIIWDAELSANFTYTGQYGVNLTIQNINAPTISTQPATQITSTTATLQGYLDNDGGQACTVRFEYGTNTSYGTNTTNQTKTIGEYFNQTITDLLPGQLYRYRTYANNTVDSYIGEDQAFLTRPMLLTNFTAHQYSETKINLTWTKAVGANQTYIERYSTPTWNRGEGTLIYNDTGISFQDTQLLPGETYYYKAWSVTIWTYNPTLYQYSESSANASTETIYAHKSIISKTRESYSLEVNQNATILYGTIKNTTLTAAITTEWHHVALTYDGSNMRLYMDGNLVNQTSLSGAIPTTSQPLQAGKFLTGWLDEIRISHTTRSSTWINITYQNTKYPESFASFGPQQGVLSTWTYRKLITIDKSVTSENLQNFPLLIHTQTDTNLVDNADVTGYDIIFMPTDESWMQGTWKNKLDYEIENYNPSTGELTVWVRLPTLSASQDTEIFMYYANSLCVSNKQNPTGVWDEHYVARYSMADHTTSSIRDSTSNSNHGTKNTTNHPQQNDGFIAYAQQFNGSGDFIKIDDTAELRLSEFTLSGWFAAESGTNTLQTIVSRQTSTHERNFAVWVDDNSGFFTDTSLIARVGNGTNNIFTLEANDKNYLDAQWYYFTCTVNNATKEASLYVNGQLKDSNNTWTEHVWIQQANTSIGAQNLINRFFNGYIDELRISNIARSLSYIQASYNNQNNTAAYVNFGPQRTKNTPPVLSNPQPQHQAIGIDITPQLKITITDKDADELYITFKTNASGSWENIGTNNSVYNGTYTQYGSMMNNHNTTYYWSVNATDGQDWTNATYQFSTIAAQTYYFNNYDTSNTTWDDISNLIDGQTNTYAFTNQSNQSYHLNATTFTSIPTSQIQKVEIRIYAYYENETHAASLYLQPIYNNSDGSEQHISLPANTASWSNWIDITTGLNAPNTWDEQYLLNGNLTCKIRSYIPDQIGEPTIYASKVELKISYMP
jgi:uncharacterized repeat protein (TIGR02543 family)